MERRTIGPHSSRRATEGATRLARIAGKRHAVKPIKASNSTVEPKATGSAGPTPYKRPLIVWARPSAAATPMANPRAICFAPFLTNILRISVRFAPSAIRTPPSRLRRVTEGAMTPYISEHDGEEWNGGLNDGRDCAMLELSAGIQREDAG